MGPSETCSSITTGIADGGGQSPELRGKRDSAVRCDVAARAEPATASVSAHWGNVGAGSLVPVAVAEQVSAVGDGAAG